MPNALDPRRCAQGGLHVVRPPCCRGTSHIRLGGQAALLSEVQQHVQATIAAPTEAVVARDPHEGLNRRYAGQRWHLGHAEAWPRHPQRGDQAGDNNS
jgi:hypothetical protein